MHPLLSHMPACIRARIPPDALDGAYEIRLRTGVQLEIRSGAEGRLIGEKLTRDELREVVSQLTNHSLYALEQQFREGYFPLRGGCRAGVTGGYVNGGLAHPAFVSVRMARQIPGAADALMPHILQSGQARSCLLLSAPMMGKTTMLRDAARQLSKAGLHVAIADERCELAGCLDGVPQLDVGPMTDVCDGAPKREAVPMLIRAMSPDVIVTDELGGPGDAEAVLEAARCGVAVLASAHAGSFEQAKARRALGPLFEDRLFPVVALLGGKPGRILRIVDGEGGV